jgi:hypothetical protein
VAVAVVVVAVAVEVLSAVKGWELAALELRGQKELARSG